MGADGVTLIAAIEDGWIGMTMSRLDREDATVAGLYGLWVAPSARRAGIGRRLVAAAAAWARERGARRMVLLVVASNADAVALYRQAGFVETERTIPLPRDPSIVEIEMELTLDW
jgi:ribosomal protein S18 acetylase RimI-like enzyme